MTAIDSIAEDIAEVEAIVVRARTAQAAFEAGGSLVLYDRAAQSAAWAIMEPSRNKYLAELAVETTGLGNVADKITKNHRKTQRQVGVALPQLARRQHQRGIRNWMR